MPRTIESLCRELEFAIEQGDRPFVTRDPRKKDEIIARNPLIQVHIQRDTWKSMQWMWAHRNELLYWLRQARVLAVAELARETAAQEDAIDRRDELGCCPVCSEMHCECSTAELRAAVRQAREGKGDG